MEQWVENIAGCMDYLADNFNSEANINDNSCLYSYEIDLHSNANLISFLTLPDDISVDAVFE